MKAQVGSELWNEKMETVYALNEEAEKFLFRATKLRKQAVESDKSDGKGKREREESMEERVKRCRM
jgi:hypothetical protein